MEEAKKQKPKRQIRQRPSKSTEHAVSKLEVLITIVDRNKGEFYADLIQSFEVNIQMLVLGRGTARAEIMRYLGLDDSHKTVVVSIVLQEKKEAILNALGEKFRTIKNGKGIAFTVPMSSIIGVAIYGFLSNNKSTVKEEQK